MTNLQDRYRLFIGSSSESKNIAYRIKDILPKQFKNSSFEFEVEVWDDYPESNNGLANQSFMQSFEIVLDNYDFGLFILSDDDFVFSRNHGFKGTRDNVILEAGMFIGRKDINSVFFFINTNDFSQAKVPSDLEGILLKGVKWNSSLYNIHSGKDGNILYKKEQQKPNRHKGLYDKIEEKIDREIKKYCKVIANNIRERIGQNIINNKVEILMGRQECYLKGIDLINSAKERIYTTISFKDSLKGNIKGEKEMKESLENKLIESLSEDNDLSFQRYFNTDINKIKNQYQDLMKILDKNGVTSNIDTNSYLKEIQFDALELIISDNDVLMVFPNFSGDDEKHHNRVEFGFVIENNEKLANKIAAWLIKKLSKKVN